MQIVSLNIHFSESNKSRLLPRDGKQPQIVSGGDNSMRADWTCCDLSELITFVEEKRHTEIQIKFSALHMLPFFGGGTRIRILP